MDQVSVQAGDELLHRPQFQPDAVNSPWHYSPARSAAEARFQPRRRERRRPGVFEMRFKKSAVRGRGFHLAPGRTLLERRPTTTARAPCARQARVMAAPIPAPPPVTMMTLSLSPRFMRVHPHGKWRTGSCGEEGSISAPPSPASGLRHVLDRPAMPSPPSPSP